MWDMGWIINLGSARDRWVKKNGGASVRVNTIATRCKISQWLNTHCLDSGLSSMRPKVIFWTNADDVIKWKRFLRYWPFVREIHRSAANSPHEGQWRGALMFTLICAWRKGWVNNHEAGDLRRYRAHYDVTVMMLMTKYRFCIRIQCKDDGLSSARSQTDSRKIGHNR